MDPIRVFVASPGDVANERDLLARVVDDINLTATSIAPEKGVRLELLRWETHVHPGMGDGPQGVIDTQVGPYDIFIGIMWKRFGTPTRDALSGTEHEYRLAYENWQRTRRPEIMFYFCQEPIPVATTLEEHDQVGRVIAFRNELSAKGLLADYPTHESFRDIVKGHLLMLVNRMVAERTGRRVWRQEMSEQALNSELSNVRKDANGLAEEFERVRWGEPFTDERTRKLEAIYSKMRAQASLSYALLGELISSNSPGKRLLAVSILEAFPDAEYLSWVTDRIRPDGDTPFIRYHAAVALLVAARQLDASDCPRLDGAIRTAEGYVRADRDDPGESRLRIIEDAQKELARKCHY